MSVIEQPLEYRRLVAPREDRGLLIDPPAEDIGNCVERNLTRRHDDATNVDLQGRTITELATAAREQLIRAALEHTRSYRDIALEQCGVSSESTAGQGLIFLAGHQPNLFHAGVWCKNFALAHMAQQAGATAINLLIDSDAVKRTSIRVPGGTTTSPRLHALELDAPPPNNLPYEEYSIADRQLFDSFGTRAAEAISSLIPDPLIRSFWPQVVERADATGLLGLSLAQARHQTEGNWGINTLELPQSTICQLESFHYFTAHLLAHLPRFWDIYNGAVHEYRRVHKIRGTAHPVPDLAVKDSLLEAPFWVWDANDRQRRHLFVGQKGGELRLTDRADINVQLSATADGDLDLATEQLAALATRGIKIRTRALVTTMFARLFLGDLFIHGIGGAKYDSLTDLLVRRFFHVEPPEFVTVSATLQLPIEREKHSSDDVRCIQHQLRELVYHPERVLRDSEIDRSEELKKIADLKRHWVQTVPTPENVQARHRAISGANESMQPFVASRHAELRSQQEQLLTAVRNERILASREHEFCFYPAQQLQDFLLDYLPARV